MNKFRKVSEEEIEYNLANLKQIVFEVTDACNLCCKYCGYSELYEGYDVRNNKKLDFNKAKLIIDYLYNIWEKNHCDDVYQKTAISFYGGEPLLNMSLIKEIIAYIESLKPVGRIFIYSMTTNAVLLNQYMDYLVKKNFQLLISLDGNKENQSYRINHQGKNSFDRVYANVKALQRKFPAYFERYVNFNAVLHNRNSVDSIHDFIFSEFNKSPSIVSLNPTGIRKDKIEEYKRTYQNLSDSISQSCNKENLEEKLFSSNPNTEMVINYLFRHSGNIYRNYSELLINKNNLVLYPTGTCLPFIKKMFITVNGRILACEKIHHQFSLGQIDENKVNLDYLEAAKKHNNYIFKFIKHCQSCARKDNCLLCIYQVDDIDNVPTQCKYYITQAGMEDEHSKGLSYLNKHPYLYNKILNYLTITD